jgi:hypothetical protein
METEPSAAPSRTRPILLILLGVAVAAFLLMWLGGSTGSNPRTSNPPVAQRQDQTAAGEGPIDPKTLDVHLEALVEKRPGPGETERNPFRFQPKAPPPAPAQRPSTLKPPVEVPTGPPPPPPPPPITVKFLGTIDLPNGKTVALLTDCTAGHQTTQAADGQSVFGQYRLVKIGVESVVIEHLDGRGRTTLAKNGQECVWK